MNKTTLKGLLTFLFVFSILFTNAQLLISKDASQNLWEKTNESRIVKLDKVHRSSQAKNFQLYHLNLKGLKARLANAPMRGDVVASKSPVRIAFPNASGEFEVFAIIETPAMEFELARKMPMIKAYAGQGIDDPSATMRFTVTQFGLHTMTLSGTKRSWYIDPYTEDKSNYIIYSKEALGVDTQGFECLTGERVELPSLKGETSALKATDDNKLRTYRLAQSCTGEYGTIFKGSGTVAAQKANVQAQMTITMTRVNGIYERDLATTMIFVANNDAVIYLTANSDPWTNEWNTQTAVTLDNVIGVNNYDIGHNFNTTGGGNAGCLGCVCTSTSQSNTHKGRGYTGRADPTGDPFDVDYVSHEMGHQFNGFHTMNTCSRSGSGATEVEPASGSTIMGYAGICTSNIQSNSDAYFNYVNVRDISANIKTGPSSSCDVETNIGNSAPTADAGSNFIIPVSTPYMLIGNSTDADGTASHTFTWEQNDPEQAPNGEAPPAANSATGPMVRSLEGTTNPIRYIPNLPDLITTGGSTTWEVLPSVSRSMEFALTVRDNNAGGGQTADDLMTVTTNAAAGPFTVSSQNTNSVWAQGSTQIITWNIASTNAAPINAANVDILLSKDGGLTFPTVLAMATTNDGSHSIIVPNGESSNCRIMVKGSGNIFFNINTAIINISGSVGPTISYSATFGNIVEGSDCNFTDITVPLTIGQGPTQSATATFAIAGGDATSGLDFDIMTPNVTFAQGATNSQDLILRVYNDSFAEVDETVTIDFSVNSNGGDAVVGSNSYTFTINNDDSGAPAGSSIITTVLNSDFETTDTTVWTDLSTDGETGNDWSTFQGLTYTGINGVFAGSLSNDVLGSGANYSPDNFYISPAINISISTANVSFTYGIGGYLDNEPYEVYWTTNITNVASITAGVLLDSGNSIIDGGEIKNINATNINDETGYFVVRHLSQGTGAAQTDGILLLDNVSIVVTETIAPSIQTAINTGTTEDQINFLGAGNVYTADGTGDLMLDIINNNADNYGCTNVSVSRSGTSAQAYNGSVSPAFVTDKTFTIIPTNSITSGDTDITFYFTDAEISGWETATGLSRNNLFAHRSGSNDVVALTNADFGSDVTLTANFTGIDGTYYFGTEDAFRTAVAPKVYLQGAILNSTGGLMRDDIRSMISTTSPYDATICNASVFTVTGNDAIVDWVLVELRDANTNTAVVASQSALLQRDGDVVSVDGTSTLTFNQPSANYYVAIKHRNHLGIMTANSILLRVSNVATVDFTDATSQITFGSNAQTTFGVPLNTVAMWTGNVNDDTVVQYSGTTPDSPSILSEVLNAPGNFLNFPTYTLEGYNVNDVNMDGNTQYTGTNPDTPFILQNVLSHPGNFLNFSTYQIQEQLPEN